MRHIYVTLLAAIAAAIALPMSVGVAVAQQAGAAAQEPGGLEEVVVTARKREEKMQNVPIAMSALSQTEVEHSFARDLKDIASMSPNLVIDDTSQGPGGVAAITIRGIGVSDVEKSFDPAIGVVLDGVFIGSNTGGILKSFDIASIEVLRGPQGTVFGRNAIGGVINVTRSKPTGKVGGKVRLGYGGYNTYDAEGIFNFPITDTLAAKLSAGTHQQKKGYDTNVNTGGDVGREDYKTYGASLLFKPSSAFDIQYTFNREETSQDTPPLLNNGQPDQLFCSAFGYCATSLHSTITGSRYKVASVGLFPLNPTNAVFNVTDAADLVSMPLAATFNTVTHVLNSHWDVNQDYTFDAIYGHWGSAEKVLTDWDGTPQMLYHTSRPGDWRQDSLELRLANKGNGPFNWVAGLYLWDSAFDIRLRSYIGFSPDFPGQILDIAQYDHQTAKSYAGFFEGDYKFADAWTLTLGGRYTKDKKSTAARGLVDTSVAPVGGFPPGVGSDPSHTWSQFTPKFGLKYQINPSAMAYATYSQGYRSGGFLSRVSSYNEAIAPYNQETVSNYELGLKSEFLDNKLRLNFTVFQMNYKDKQEEIHLKDTSSSTGQKTIVLNASTATMKGAEIEMEAHPSNGLNLRANVAYLKSKYDKFNFHFDATTVVDYSYLKFRRAPEVTGNVDATYEWNVGANAKMWSRLSYHYIGSYFTDFSNAPEVANDVQHLLDASVNVEFGDTRLSLYGRNLTGADGYMIGYDVAGLWSYSAARPPRTWGAEVTYRFGEK
jgi:iron complex outermembrane recepter protein